MGEIGSATARPMRADARRNYDRLVTAARAAFAEHGAEASLDDIARPTRLALLEAVYRDDVTALCAEAEELGRTRPPGDALAAWLRVFVRHAAVKRGLAAALKASLGEDTSAFFLECSTALRAASQALLTAAQQAGAVRADARVPDLLKLVHGIAVATEHSLDDPGQAERLLSVVLDGLRPPPVPG